MKLHEPIDALLTDQYGLPPPQISDSSLFGDCEIQEKTLCLISGFWHLSLKIWHRTLEAFHLSPEIWHLSVEIQPEQASAAM